MKVIFLDIDGVLNSREYDRLRDWSELSYIDETRLPFLKRIIDATGAVVVLTSTWRKDWSENAAERNEDGAYMYDIFTQYGIDIFSTTPDLGLNADRADEIREWLGENPEVDRYVIIDDCRYAWGDMSDCFVKTDAYKGRGLEDEHVSAAIEILGGYTFPNIIGRRVHVIIDRKLGSVHPSHKHIVYSVNYGYIDDIIGGDGEEQDAYVLGVKEPIDAFDGVITAVIHRVNDNEDKWIVVPEGYIIDDKTISEETRFMEQFFESILIR